MSKLFYPRMAFSNIRKNKNVYVPYLLASMLIVSLFYSLSSIGKMVSDSSMKGAESIASMLMASTFIYGFFSVIIIFYINSFVVKRRKKEFGLYNVLGMEKRHIARVMSLEVFIAGVISIVCGIALGALTSQLLFLVLLKLIRIPAPLTFKVPLSSVMMTIALFVCIFTLALIYDIIMTAKTNPIELLHSSTKGEKEPKAKWILALLGAIILGTGYAFALTVKTPSEAVSVFMIAVLLVIIGTFLLFIAGSIAILKLLRRNKKFYYKAENFISVSGMMYRMKQNAVGLSSICILATAVLVTLSSTVCLFIGAEDILSGSYPRQILTTAINDKNQPEALSSAAKSHAEKYGFEIVNDVYYSELGFPCYKNGSSFVYDGIPSFADSQQEVARVKIIPLKEYNKAANSTRALEQNQVLLSFNDNTKFDSDSITINNNTFEIADIVEYPQFMEQESFIKTATIIVPSVEYIDELEKSLFQAPTESNGDIQSSERSFKTHHYYYDVLGDSSKLPQFYDTMRDDLVSTVSRLAIVTNVDSARNDYYQMYGGLLFIGIFFVILFLIVTVLIIYYKQITEGYDDHDRFQIMHKVGMSDKEIKSTIKKQILMVFFLPIGMAIVHIAVAFPVLCKILTIFGMANTLLFVLCTVASVVLFATLYLIVYQLTAKAYYKIVL